MTLASRGTVKGRLLDDNGRPLKQAAITVYYRQAKAKDAVLSFLSRDIRTDDDGTFRIGGLPPDMVWFATVLEPEEMYPRTVFAELSLTGGETKDFGEMKPPKNGDAKKGDE